MGISNVKADGDGSTEELKKLTAAAASLSSEFEESESLYAFASLALPAA